MPSSCPCHISSSHLCNVFPPFLLYLLALNVRATMWVGQKVPDKDHWMRRNSTFKQLDRANKVIWGGLHVKHESSKFFVWPLSAAWKMHGRPTAALESSQCCWHYGRQSQRIAWLLLVLGLIHLSSQNQQHYLAAWVRDRMQERRFMPPCS